MASVGTITVAGARTTIHWRFESAAHKVHTIKNAHVLRVVSVAKFGEALEAEPPKVPVVEITAALELAILRALDAYRDVESGAGLLSSDCAKAATATTAVDNMLSMIFCDEPATGGGLMALFLTERVMPELVPVRRIWWQLLAGRATPAHDGELMSIAYLALNAHLAWAEDEAPALPGPSAVNPHAMFVAAMRELQLRALSGLKKGADGSVSLGCVDVVTWARANVKRCVNWLHSLRGKQDAWGRFAQCLPLLTRVEWDIARRIPQADAALANARPRGNMFFQVGNLNTIRTMDAVFYGKFAPLHWLNHAKWKSVCLAGGAAAAGAFRLAEWERARNTRAPGWESSDLDLFVFGTPEERTLCVARLLGEFAKRHPDASVWCDRGIYTIDISAGPRESSPEHMQYNAGAVRVQVIDTEFANGEDLVARFDQTYLQWFLAGGMLYGTAEALVSLHCGANWYTGAQVGSRAFKARGAKAVMRGMRSPAESPFIASLRVFSIAYWDDNTGKLNLEYGDGIPEDKNECEDNDVCTGFNMFSLTDTPMRPLDAITEMKKRYSVILRDPVSHTWTDLSKCFIMCHGKSRDVDFALDLVTVKSVTTQQNKRTGRWFVCAVVDVPPHAADKIRSFLAVRANYKTQEEGMDADRGSVVGGGTTAALILGKWGSFEWAGARDPVPHKVAFPRKDDAFIADETLDVRVGDVISVAGHGIMVGEDYDSANTKFLAVTTGRSHGPCTPYLRAFMDARARVEQ